MRRKRWGRKQKAYLDFFVAMHKLGFWFGQDYYVIGTPSGSGLSRFFEMSEAYERACDRILICSGLRGYKCFEKTSGLIKRFIKEVDGDTFGRRNKKESDKNKRVFIRYRRLVRMAIERQTPKVRELSEQVINKPIVRRKKINPYLSRQSIFSHTNFSGR